MPGAGPWARQSLAGPYKGSSRRSETATLGFSVAAAFNATCGFVKRIFFSNHRFVHRWILITFAVIYQSVINLVLQILFLQGFQVLFTDDAVVAVCT
jgi:hypothetical protein